MSVSALLEKIDADGRSRADAIRREAESDVAVVVARRRGEEAKLRDDAKQRAERQAAAIVERARSQARLLHRNAVLAARWQAVDEVTRRAGATLVGLPDYPKLMSGLAAKHLRDRSKVRFSAADTPRMRQSLGDVVGQPAAISGGVIVCAEGMEIDYSVDTLLAASRRLLASDIAAALSA